MARGMPSMTALLGLLAVAGYQNRDKIGEFLQRQQAGHTGVGAGSPQPVLGGAQPGGVTGNQGGGLGDLFSGDSANPHSLGNVINSGLGSRS